MKNENEFLQKKIKCLKGNELIASGNKKFAEEALKKNALIFQDQIENSVKQVDTHMTSRTCDNSGNTNQGNAHLHRELI